MAKKTNSLPEAADFCFCKWGASVWKKKGGFFVIENHPIFEKSTVARRYFFQQKQNVLILLKICIDFLYQRHKQFNFYLINWKCAEN